MKIGILGGTFDPPHYAHLVLARTALEQLELDEVLWVPAARNPLKKGRAINGKIRLEMIQLVIEKEPQMASSDIEVSRGGPSYIVDTLNELTFVRPAEYWLIMGGDSLKTFTNWKAPEKLVKLCRLAVALRPPFEKEELLTHIPEDWHSRIDWLDMDPSEISASEIRLRSEEKRLFAQYVPSKVYDYIKKHKLYGL